VGKYKILGILILLIVVVILGLPFINGEANRKPSISSSQVNFNSTEDIQRYLGDIIKLEDLTKEEVSKTIKALPNLDWDKLVKDNGKKFKKNFVEWLSQNEIEDVEETTALIGVLNKFSKKDYVKITEVLADKFIEDKTTFIKALTIKKSYLKELGYAFHFLELYERDGLYLADDFEEILNSEELTKAEKSIGFEFVDIIATCET